MKYILVIDKLPLKCRSKIDIVQQYVFSKLKWRFLTYNISEIWVAENINNEVNRYRKWLQVPISANITHLSLPKKMLSFNIKTAQQIQAQCKLSVRRILKTSRNEEIRTSYNLTSSKNVKSDCIFETTRVPENRQMKQYFTKALSKQSIESTWKGLLNLNEQSGIIRSLVEQFGIIRSLVSQFGQMVECSFKN